MAEDEESAASTWSAVIARALAFLCLIEGDLRGKDLAIQGHFLESLGLTRKDASALLGTSYASLSELYRQAGKKKGGKRGGSRKR